MDNAIPDLGIKRNVAIRNLLTCKWGLPEGASENAYFNAPDVILAEDYDVPESMENSYNQNLPNYCGDDADCFRLLVTLQKRRECLKIESRTNGDGWIMWVYTIEPESEQDGWEEIEIKSEFSDEEGWRDTVTQAAWLVLTAANKVRE